MAQTRVDRSDLARGMFSAFMSGDRLVAEVLLADEFTFTSPYDDKIDKAAYFERCWPNRRHITEQTIERIFEKDDEAFVQYHCVTDDGNEFRNTELLVFEGDRIRRIEVYFGAVYREGKLLICS